MKLVRLTAAAVGVLLVSSPSEAQGRFPPDSLVNLQVIPKNTPVREVIAMMRDFTFATGLRCTHCHVGEENRPLSTYDFRSDEKPTKRIARVMLQMVNEINGEHLSKLPSRSSAALRVRCETCHRGVARPEPIEAVVANALSAGGPDSAVRAYRALLTEYQERGSYDFTDSPLSELARQLAGRRQFDEALVLLQLNEDTHPTSADVPFMRGEVLLAKGDTSAAVAAYRVAQQRNPQGPARFRLRDLEVR